MAFLEAFLGFSSSLSEELSSSLDELSATFFGFSSSLEESESESESEDDSLAAF